MSDISQQVRQVIRKILKDISVELKDEFSQNFDRQAFFTQAWERRKGPLRPGGATLVASGDLKRSIRSEIRDNSVVFLSDHPAAAAHNEGCEIVVTARMKKFFRAKFYEAQGGFERGKTARKHPLTDGGFYQWTSKMALTPEAEFWRAMALKRVGSKIRIPKRQFIGTSPEVEAAVRRIIEENLTDYINNIDFNIK